MSIKKKTTILAALVIFAVFSIAAAALMSFSINVTDAYVNQSFTVTATASETNGTITAMTIEHFNQSDWQPQQCNTGNTCTKSWTFKEEKAGNYTFRIKAKNSLGKIAIDSFTVEVKKPSVTLEPLKVNLRANPSNGEEPLDVMLRCSVDESNKKPFNYVLDIDGEVFFNTTDDEDHVITSHVFDSGLYNVTCTVIDSEGRTGTDSTIVNVTDQPVADLPPYITLIAPADGIVLSINNVTAQFMAVDDVSEEINCSLYAASDTSAEWQDVWDGIAMNATMTSIDFTNVPDGTYTWNVACTDGAGNSAFADGNFTLTVDAVPDDNTAPVVGLVSPANGAMLTDNNISLIYIISDDYSSELACTLYGGASWGSAWDDVETQTASLGENSFSFTNVPDGDYVWNVECVDGYGAAAFAAENYTFSMNTTPIFVPQCADGLDNDADGLIDLADAGCLDNNDDNETDEIPPVVDLAPVVTLIAPADNAIFMDTNNITAQYIATDDITQNMTCSVAVVDADGNFQLVGDVHSAINNTMISVDFTNVPNGAYVWNVLCIDELWNLGYNPLNFTVTVNYTQPVLAQCADGIDNDGDSLIDLADAGCTDVNDDNETDEIVCQNNLEISGVSIGGTDIPERARVTMLLDADGEEDAIPFDYNFTNYGITEITNINYTITMTSDATGDSNSETNGIVSIGPQTSFIEGNDFDSFVTPLVEGLYNMSLSVEGVDADGCIQNDEFSFYIEYSSLSLPECSDGADNDADGLVDFPEDLGCTDANDDNETDEIITPPVDSIAPAVQIIAPQDGEVITSSNVTVQFIASDETSANLTCAAITIDGTDVEVAGQGQTVTNNTITSFDFTNVPNGVYTWNVACVDEAWNIGMNPMNFTNIINATIDVPPVVYQCNDSMDNDGDGLIDLADPGCVDANDDNETDEIVVIPTQCADGIDNDGDGLIDLVDPGCLDANDDNETDEIIVPPVDSIAPAVQIIAPQDGEVITSSNVTVQYIAADETSTNLTCAVFVFNDGNAEQVSDAILTANNTLISINFTNVPDGQYTWNVWCIDEAWNLGMNPMNFTNMVNATDNSTNQTQNHAPIFDPIDNMIVSESHVVFITPVATDPDGDNVTITASNLPAGATFEMGALFWIPDYSQAGNYNITFTASDGQLDTSIDVMITVLDVPPEQQMVVTLVSDAVSGTAPLDVNFTCSVENGESPYSYVWIVYDESQLAFDLGFSWPVTDSTFSFNEILGAGNWTASCIVGDFNGTIVTSNNITITVDAQPVLAQCADGLDNDADGLIDLADLGCVDADDDNETDEIAVLPQCNDSLDNDVDGLIDFPSDLGCTDADDDNETDEIPPVVDLAPVVTLIAPADNAIFTGTNNITAQYIVTDDITQNMTCSVAVVDADGNFQLVGDVHSAINNTITSVEFTNVPNNVYVWNVLCIDELWNLGYNPANLTATVNFTQPVANSAPVLDTIGSFVAYENSTLLFSVSATDADNDTLAFSASGLPSGASFSNVTRTFIWTPDFTQSGNYTVTFLVTDGIASDSEAVQITVNDVNNGTDGDDDDQGDDNDNQGDNNDNGGGSSGGNNGHGSNFDCPLNQYREDGRCVSAGGSGGHSQQPASPASSIASAASGDDDGLTAGILGGQGKDNNGKVIEGDLKITGNAVAEPQAQNADFAKTFFGITLLIAAVTCIIVGIYRLYAYRAGRMQIVDMAQAPSQNVF